MNIVFDLGAVVFNWQPDALAKSAFKDPEWQRLLRSQIIGHPDWLELDRGTLTVEQAVLNASSRTGIPEADIAGFFRNLPESLTPIQPTIDLIERLGKSEHDLFVLSNIHHASIAWLESTYDIFRLFKGRVYSCRIGMIKPERQIFDYLLSSQDLIAERTVFIDDMPENTQAAAQLGIKTIQFKNTDSTILELRKLGLSV